MGQEITQVAAGKPDVEIVGCAGSADDDAALADLACRAEVLIDFSTPDGTMRAVRAAVESGTPLVVGTTGLTDDQVATLRDAARTIPVWYARNMSHGVGVLLHVLPRIAAALADYDIEVIEAHTGARSMRRRAPPWRWRRRSSAGWRIRARASLAGRGTRRGSRARSGSMRSAVAGTPGSTRSGS
jgi:4-hydroxy-tetrahydrodipicolinate reductase